MGCFIKITQSRSAGANPYFFMIGNDGIDVAATFFVLIFTVKSAERSAVKTVQTALGCYPQKAFIILYNVVDGNLRQPVLGSVSMNFVRLSWKTWLLFLREKGKWRQKETDNQKFYFYFVEHKNQIKRIPVNLSVVSYDKGNHLKWNKIIITNSVTMNDCFFY